MPENRPSGTPVWTPEPFMNVEKFVRKPILTVAILALGFLPLYSQLLAQQDLDNKAILKMAKAGLSAEIVSATVNANPGHYDVSPDAMIALKKAGVGDAVIAAMIAKNSGGGAQTQASAGGAGFALASAPSAASNANGLPPGVDSVGVYVKDASGNWAEVDAEVVNFKTGGALKHISSAGIVKGDLNGNVAGFHSRLGLHSPAEFILYVPEGTSPGEYQLIRFRVSSNSREFRSLTGGVAHTSGGAVRDTVEFTSRKIAPRVYQVTVGGDRGKGEFGFLPPLDTLGGKNVSSSGKIYTFTLGD
jgi:hypothetical protein